MSDPRDTSNLNSDSSATPLSAIVSELLFIVLPLVVVAAVSHHKNDIEEFLSSPEWSFCACIVYGQIVVRLATIGTLIGGKVQIKHYNLELILTVFVVLGLAPCLVILTIVLMTPKPSFALGITQVLLAVVSFAMFLLVGVGIREVFRAMLSGRKQTSSLQDDVR